MDRLLWNLFQHLCLLDLGMGCLDQVNFILELSLLSFDNTLESLSHTFLVMSVLPLFSHLDNQRIIVYVSVQFTAQKCQVDGRRSKACS